MARPRVVLDQINIVVKDVPQAVDFYSRLGIEIPDALAGFQNHHRMFENVGELHTDLDSAAFAERWNEGWKRGEAGVVLGFRTESREDVDTLYAELTEAGYRGQQAPYDAFWGARYAIVQDPSGNSVGLMSPVDPDRRRVPPSPPD